MDTDLRLVLNAVELDKSTRILATNLLCNYIKWPRKILKKIVKRSCHTPNVILAKVQDAGTLVSLLIGIGVDAHLEDID